MILFGGMWVGAYNVAGIREGGPPVRSFLTILGLAAVAAVALAVVLAIVRAYFRSLGDRARRRDLEAVAEEYGLRFSSGSHWEPPVQCLHLPLFRDAYGREARNLMMGHLAGQPAMVFQYEFFAGSGNPPKLQRYHVGLFKLPIDAPRLVVRSVQIQDVLAHWLGLDPIETESEEFNRRYHVMCADRKFAFDICRPVVMEALLDGEAVPVLEMEGRFLLMYDGPLASDKFAAPAMSQRFLAVGRRILESIPEYVRHDHSPRDA